MRFRLQTAALVLVFGASMPAHAAKPWQKVASTNFEVYTSAGEKRALAVIRTFEETLDLFGEFNGQRPRLTNRIRVILFRNQRDFLAYAPDPDAAAFYTADDRRDVILLRQAGGHEHHVGVHEFIHLLLYHSTVQYPRWFEEGLAEVYSTVRRSGRQFVLGHLIPRHVKDLKNAAWIDLQELLTTDSTGPLPKAADRKAMFYAQSWALCHMLLFDSHYVGGRETLMALLEEGRPAGEIFAQVYDKTIPEVRDDLIRYLARPALALFTVDISSGERETDRVTVEDAKASDVDLALAEVLAMAGRHGDSLRAYKALSRRLASDWRVEHGRARLSRRIGDTAAAREHYSRAIRFGADDPTVFVDYAKLLHAADESPGEIARVLRKALEIEPGNVEASTLLRTWSVGGR